MPRQPRQRADTNTYHVLFRGVNRDAIFIEREDFARFLHVLAIVKQVSECQILAYCLMPNHVHLVLVCGVESIGATMKRLGIRYAGWFNRKYGRVGHVFQDRFKSLPVDEDSYLVQLVRYVWLNPVSAGMVSDPADYEWNSCAPRQPAGLVDDEALDALLPSLAREQLLKPQVLTAVLSAPQNGVRYTAAEAIRMLEQACGLPCGADFGALDEDAQRAAIKSLRARSVTYAVIAQITGLSPSKVRRLHVASAPANGISGPRTYRAPE